MHRVSLKGEGRSVGAWSRSSPATPDASQLSSAKQFHLHASTRHSHLSFCPFESGQLLEQKKTAMFSRRDPSEGPLLNASVHATIEVLYQSTPESCIVPHLLAAAPRPR